MKYILVFLVWSSLLFACNTKKNQNGDDFGSTEETPAVEIVDTDLLMKEVSEKLKDTEFAACSVDIREKESQVYVYITTYLYWDAKPTEEEMKGSLEKLEKLLKGYSNVCRAYVVNSMQYYDYWAVSSLEGGFHVTYEGTSYQQDMVAIKQYQPQIGKGKIIGKWYDGDAYGTFYVIYQDEDDYYKLKKYSILQKKEPLEDIWLIKHQYAYSDRLYYETGEALSYSINENGDLRIHGDGTRGEDGQIGLAIAFKNVNK